MPFPPITDVDGVIKAFRRGHRRLALAAIQSLPLSVLQPASPSPRSALLVEAIGAREWGLVRAILDRGFDANETPSGETPLMAACRVFRVDWVSTLLDKGADPNCVNGLGEGVFHAVLGGRNACLAEERYGDLQDPAAIRRIDATTLTLFERLHAGGASVAPAVERWSSPLLSVAQERTPTLLDWFLEKGANADWVGPSGNTPFMMAARAAAHTHDPTIVLRLLAAGANPHRKNHANEGAGDFYEGAVSLNRKQHASWIPWSIFYPRCSAQALEAVPLGKPQSGSRARCRF